MVLAVVGSLAFRGVAPLRAAPATSAVPPEMWREAGVVAMPQRIEAPRFALRDLAGRVVRLEDFRGHLVLLYFWATW